MMSTAMIIITIMTIRIMMAARTFGMIVAVIITIIHTSGSFQFEKNVV